MFKKLLLLLPILPKLGFRNVAYVVWYRVSLKMGWRKNKFPLGKAVEGLFFKETTPLTNYPEAWKTKTIEKADQILKGNLTWFRYHNFQVGNPPNWFKNPFDDSVLNIPHKHWTEISDFDLNTGDVKILWELSRFDWLTDLARAYRVTGYENYLEAINYWLIDWSKHNPNNQGPNWKCGQETAIRVMKLITTAQILNQDTTAQVALQQMIAEHLERIAANIHYAIAQDNNHGTSEAAGLCIGSTWLLQQKLPQWEASLLKQWKNKGRKLLENRIDKLIAPQGTFAQRSVTYHRVVVDTMSWVLYAMERYNEPAFPENIQNRLQKLGEWQYKMIASHNGEVPNIGSNDGAMFETLHNCGYRDFRPSTQLFFGVLNKQRAFDNDVANEVLFWRYPENYNRFKLYQVQQPILEGLDEEIVILNDGVLKVFLKLPNQRYRFATCDAFHLDVWYNGENLFCDSGSYSYNAGAETDKFKSVTMHNTVQFDSHEQMPKISRFLYGNWLQVTEIIKSEDKDGIWSWKGSYKDYRKNSHYRTIEWNREKNQLAVTDDLDSPSEEEKTLYWHSAITKVPFDKLTVTDADGQTLEPQVFTSARSLYYLQKSEKITYAYSTKTKQLKSTIQF